MVHICKPSNGMWWSGESGFQVTGQSVWPKGWASGEVKDPLPKPKVESDQERHKPLTTRMHAHPHAYMCTHIHKHVLIMHTTKITRAYLKIKSLKRRGCWEYSPHACGGVVEYLWACARSWVKPHCPGKQAEPMHDTEEHIFLQKFVCAY